MFVILSAAVLLAGCSSPMDSGGDSGPPATPAATTLTVDNGSTGSFVLHAGSWSDTVASRQARWGTSSIGSNSQLVGIAVTAGIDAFWLEIGDSHYLAEQSGVPYDFSIVDRNSYWLTVDGDPSTGLTWTFFNLMTPFSPATGGFTEFSKLPPPDPALLDIYNETSDNLVLHGGTWDEVYADRDTAFSTSTVFAASNALDREIAAGSYELWIETGEQLYPLLAGEVAATFTFENEGEYSLTIESGSPDTWHFTDGDVGISGEVGSTGYSPDPPPPPPQVPSNLRPTDGQNDVSIFANLTWNSDRDVDGYDVYLDTSDGTTLVAEDLTYSFYNPDDDLELETTYSWRVVAKNEGGETSSEVQSFTTEDPVKVSFSSPYAGNTNRAGFLFRIDYNERIDRKSLEASDFAVTGGATIEVHQSQEDYGRLAITMPSYSSAVTVTLPPGSITNKDGYKTNTDSAEISFDYYHFPMADVSDIDFQADGKAVWGIDRTNGSLLRYDVPAGVVMHSFDLPYDSPVSLTRLGNVLYIVYANSDAISRFEIEQSTPEDSTLLGGELTIPVPDGTSFEEAFKIVSLPERNSLAIAYQYSDWPDDNLVTVISASDGSTEIEPVVTGGSSGSMVLDYANGVLVVGADSVSNGPVKVYEVENDSLTELVGETDMETYLRGKLDISEDGSRIALICDNPDIEPAGSNRTLSDFRITEGSLVSAGKWSPGGHYSEPRFSHDGLYMYVYMYVAGDDDELIVFSAGEGDYDEIRRLPLPNGGGFVSMEVSPDDSTVVAYTVFRGSNDGLFHHFTDIRR